MSPGLQILLLSVVLGVAAQWLAKAIRLPAIVPLLCFGVFFGPEGPIPIMPRPEEALPHALTALVSLGVAIILFEGGLSLNLHDLRLAPRVVRRLITIGSLISLVGASLAAHWIGGLSWGISLLFGSLMTVTGPTVISPLLKNVKVRPAVYTVLQWESILIDAIGALLAISVFGLLYQKTGLIAAASGFIWSLIIGPSIGIMGGWLLAKLLTWRQTRGESDEELDNLLALASVLGLYGLSESIAKDSGLWCVIIAGCLMANMMGRQARQLRRFKGLLTTLLVSVLFILLTANLRLEDVRNLGHGGIWVLLVLIFIIRPINIMVSSRGSKLSWREKIFLSSMAPKGIVAASVASLFALEIAGSGGTGGRELVAMTFVAILGTVLLSGLTVKPLAKLLKVEMLQRPGLLIIGAHALGQAIAHAAESQNIPVLLVDSNPERCRLARKKNLQVLNEDAMQESILGEENLSGLGSLLSLTGNHSIDTQICGHTARSLGLTPWRTEWGTHSGDQDADESRLLFAPQVNIKIINMLLDSGKAKFVQRYEKDENTSAKNKAFLPVAMLTHDGFSPVSAENQGKATVIWGVEFEMPPGDSALPFEPKPITN
ncbi:MAG: hypothetical protein A2X49_16330 [Lentisphaerae bacterium GWF2_52_8]|nr:MAG: hypothetical protein A2X49_16330 [Lentisphaerae bacterium GWF2_52_8]